MAAQAPAGEAEPKCSAESTGKQEAKDRRALPESTSTSDLLGVDSSAHGLGAWQKSYVAALASRRLRAAIVASWVTILGLGLYGAFCTFSNLRLLVDPVPGDANDVAKSAFSRTFPQRQKDFLTTVLLVSTDGSPVLALPTARAAAATLAAVAVPGIASGLLRGDSGASYYSYNDSGLALPASYLLSPDRSATLLQYFSMEGYVTTLRYKAWLVKLRETEEAVQAASGGTLTVHDTGQLPVSVDSSESITADIAISDGITVPLSFLLLACALRSLRLIMLTFLALLGAFGGAFLLTWPLSTAINTPNFTTSLLIATLVSLSLDYSLFLLFQVKLALRAGKAMPAAVEQALVTSGHTILVSGATLAACFLVLGILPVSIVRAPGIATTFAVVFSVAANLTLTPALLLSFPRFWAGGVQPAAPGRLDRGCTALVDLMAQLDPWPAMARLTRRYKYSLTIGITALFVAPFAYRLPHFTTSQDLHNIAPRDTDSVETLYHIQRAFGSGAVAGVRILGVSAAAGGALTPGFFASAAGMAQAAVAVSGPRALQAQDLGGLAFSYGGLRGNATTVTAGLTAVTALGCSAVSAPACAVNPLCTPPLCLLALQAANTLSADQRAMLLSVAVRVRRETPEGEAWAQRVRQALRDFSASPAANDVTWHLVIDPTATTVAYMFQHFGELVGITAAVVCFIVAVAFRSPALAIRSVGTLAVMEICVFGAATGVYVDGVTDPGGVLHTLSSEYGLFWLVPILSFSLITGLGLDYDIFLITAVVEERWAGYGDHDAIAAGLRRSGPVISWAGVIMAVAYSGFLFSDIPLLNQLGTMVVLAVLVDTFVVRPLYVPAVMHIAGSVNFWPMSPPPVTRTLPEALGGSAVRTNEGMAALEVRLAEEKEPADGLAAV